MAGKPHNGYSSYRAWEVALYFDNDERAYTYIQRVLKSLTYCAERDIKKYLKECASRINRYYADSYIPDTRTIISRRSILEYVKGEAAELLNHPELCKVYED